MHLKFRLTRIFFRICLLILSAILISFIPKNSYSQKKIPIGKQSVELKTGTGPLSQTPKNDYTQKELEIMEQMNQIKLENNDSYGGQRILDLQRKLETTNHSTITQDETNSFGSIIPASHFSSQQTDNINFSNVVGYAYNYIAGIATQVEQRGTTAGKIWVAVALYSGDTNGVLAKPDTISLYYSTNNGNSYNLYAKIAFGGSNVNDIDNIDMEIIENTTGTKYLHIVFGYYTNGGLGQRRIGYTVVSAPTLGYSGFTLFPPGYNASSIYTKARITSDNTRYPGNPYTTVVITQDSIVGGNHFYMSKMCRSLSPFTLTPAITYLPKSIYSVFGGSDAEVFTDVANYHNGADSLIFVLTNYPGYNQNIYLYKAFSNSTVYPVNSGILTPTGDNLTYGRVAASGGTDQKQITIVFSSDYANSGDLDQWATITTDAANWYTAPIDYTSYNISTNGDIIARRGANGSFNIVFKNVYGNLENVSMYSFNNSSSNYIHSLNTNYANSLASPKPGFRFVNSDSCLALWNYYYAVYSSTGCSASNLYAKIAIEGMYDEVTGEHSNYAPVNILLAQSFPPYNIVDTGLAYLDYQRLGNVFAFPKSPEGSYYLILKHYNSLETWSSVPVSINTTTPQTYDFTNSDEKAFGKNMTLKGDHWCIYSGDIDQNGSIDLTDVIIAYNDGINFVYGVQLPSDLNVDGYVDLDDVLIVYNNSNLFVSVIKP